MEKMMEKKFDIDTTTLIIFDLFLLFSILSTGIIYAVFLDFMNPLSINNDVELSETQQSVIIGLVIGIFSIFYMLKFYKFISKHLEVNQHE